MEKILDEYYSLPKKDNKCGPDCLACIRSGTETPEVRDVMIELMYEKFPQLRVESDPGLYHLASVVHLMDAMKEKRRAPLVAKALEIVQARSSSK